MRTPSEARPAPDLAAREDALRRREQRAYHRLLPALLESHAERFVAVHDGTVVEAGRGKLHVARRAYERFGNVPIYVGRVVAGPPLPARVPSPRRLDGPSS